MSRNFNICHCGKNMNQDAFQCGTCNYKDRKRSIPKATKKNTGELRFMNECDWCGQWNGAKGRSCRNCGQALD